MRLGDDGAERLDHGRVELRARRSGAARRAPPPACARPRTGGRRSSRRRRRRRRRCASRAGSRRPAGGRGSPRRPSARGVERTSSATRLSDGAERDDPLADQRVAAHEAPTRPRSADRAWRGSRPGSRPCRRRAARRRGGSARPPRRAARAAARCARPARRRSRGARRGRGCARSARVSSTSLLWRPADMRPACFCAYMRWSAIRSASAGSVASSGAGSSRSEQPIEKPSPCSESAAAARAHELLGVVGAGLDQHAELVAAHPERPRRGAPGRRRGWRRAGPAGRRRRGGRRCRCSA